jgi:hypothetical protein
MMTMGLAMIHTERAVAMKTVDMTRMVAEEKAEKPATILTSIINLSNKILCDK